MARQPGGKTIAINEIVVFEGLSIYSRKSAIRMSLECSPIEPALLKSAEQEIVSPHAQANPQAVGG